MWWKYFYVIFKRDFLTFLKFYTELFIQSASKIDLIHDYIELCRVQRFILAQGALESKRGKEIERVVKRLKTKRYIDHMVHLPVSYNGHGI